MKIMGKASTSVSIIGVLMAVLLSTVSAQGQLGNGLMNVVNTANDAVAKPLTDALGSITNPILSRTGSVLGSNVLNPLGPSIGLGTISGLATGAAAATSSLTGSSGSNLLGGILGGGSSSSSSSSSSSASTSSASRSAGLLGMNRLGSMQMMNGAAGMGLGNLPMMHHSGAAAAAAAGAAASSREGYGMSERLMDGGYGGAGLAAASGRLGGFAGGPYGSMANAAAAAHSLGAAETLGAVGAAEAASSLAGAAGAAGSLARVAGEAEAAGSLARAHNAAAVEGAVEGAVVGGAVAANHIMNREALAADAISNSNAEAAIAGNDMAIHGANNARSASLASNAYRQAKLAGARDRVNIAGTIQNTARISDAAIATHDSATKAEDSLLGSELAVDSAGTVLDSDAAYIPPVTNSLLRSLPYGRLGLRNILPRPLTYPRHLLPDVWLNGRPVNYLNLQLRQLADIGPFVGAAAGQPFYSNNGILINGLISDPNLAYLYPHINGVIGSSILPVLANGQLEASDEVAMSHAITMQQQMGYGMGATYNGYNWVNPVPMLTGSVSDVSLTPTTTIGTTYPIGSALVIEPRDSYFQDYIDSASSRQNFDERQQ